MCDGMAFCSINPTNQLFGKDPCMYIRKYLDVSYKCVTGVNIITTNNEIIWYCHCLFFNEFLNITNFLLVLICSHFVRFVLLLVSLFVRDERRIRKNPFQVLVASNKVPECFGIKMFLMPGIAGLYIVTNGKIFRCDFLLRFGSTSFQFQWIL